MLKLVKYPLIVAGLIIGLVVAPFFLLPLGQPLAKPLAVWWYKADFEVDANAAAAKFSEASHRCIYDDHRNIIVKTFAELDVEGMLERAVDDNYPRFRFERPQRDPHFRIFANDRTYWWSFREREFFAFRGNRWTLKTRLSKSCTAYLGSPVSIEKAFWERDGIRVSRENFCCGLTDPN